MRINNELAEQENHGHYIICLQRKKQIDKLCHKILIYSIIESVVFLFMLTGGFWVGALSWLPSLFGKPFSLLNLIVYFAELIIIPVIAVAGCGDKKIFTLVFFAIQCIIVTGCFFGGFRTVNTIPFLMGIAGILISFPSISAYADYRQLMQTEGFPQFSNFLADAEDNPEFISTYDKQYHNKEKDTSFIDVPETPLPSVEKVSKNTVYMDNVPVATNSENK